jgi:hypothetical protein
MRGKKDCKSGDCRQLPNMQDFCQKKEKMKDFSQRRTQAETLENGKFKRYR